MLGEDFEAYFVLRSMFLVHAQPCGLIATNMFPIQTGIQAPPTYMIFAHVGLAVGIVQGWSSHPVDDASLVKNHWKLLPSHAQTTAPALRSSAAR